MAWELVLLLVIITVAGVAAALLSSKVIAEKMITAGMLPRAFFGLIPVLQNVVRVFAITLVVAGLASTSIEAGWINRDIILKYGVSFAVMLIGVILLAATFRKSS